MSQPIDYEQTVREMIRHEDNLINNRVGWMCATSGLFATAVGFLWGKGSTTFLICGIALVGFASCFATLFTLLAATKAMARLRRYWRENVPADYKGPGVMGLDSLGPGPFHRIADYFNPWDAIALTFSLAWIGVIVIALGYGHR